MRRWGDVKILGTFYLREYRKVLQYVQYGSGRVLYDLPREIRNSGSSRSDCTPDWISSSPGSPIGSKRARPGTGLYRGPE
jgi:hypothetical protein